MSDWLDELATIPDRVKTIGPFTLHTQTHFVMFHTRNDAIHAHCCCINGGQWRTSGVDVLETVHEWAQHAGRTQ